MEKLLKKVIMQQEDHALSYDEFMETVLYHPEKGYYMKEKNKIGRSGDFYTSSNIHDVFAKLFARVFLSLINEFGIPPVICELGGGNGRFADAVLKECKQKSPETYRALTYMIIETSPYHQKLQREQIEDLDCLVQYSDIHTARKDIPSFNGIVFSNELYDAFPVKVVEKRQGQLYEAKVTWNDREGLVEKLVLTSNEEILSWIDSYLLPLAEGQRIEVPLAMEGYIRELSDWLNKAVVFTVDYGYTKQEWSEPVHKNGSLRGYYKHEMIKNPLFHPGDMDLTTHIHLDALREIGEDAGLGFVGMMRQNEFLLAGGILEYLQDNYDPNPFSDVSKQNRAVRSLLLDSTLSGAFHVVIQQKGVPNVEDAPFLKRDTKIPGI